MLVSAQILGMLAWALGKLRVNGPKESLSFELRSRCTELRVGAVQSPTTSTRDELTPGPESRSRSRASSFSCSDLAESRSKKISFPVSAAAQAFARSPPTRRVPRNQRGSASDLAF